MRLRSLLFFGTLRQGLTDSLPLRIVGKRLCIFYTSGCIAPALGGIMAGAIIRGLDGARSIPGWRWLFIVEGTLTVVCGFGFYFLLPDYPLNSRFLSPEQRQLSHIRIVC